MRTKIRLAFHPSLFTFHPSIAIRRALIATLASFVVAPEAFAQCAASGWCAGGISAKGDAIYIKVLSRSGKYVTVQGQQVRSNGVVAQAREVYDCQNGRMRLTAALINGVWLTNPRIDWDEVLPNTVGEAAFNVACR